MEREFRKFEKIKAEMDIQALKLELVRQILETESQELLDKVMRTLKKEEPDFWLELTDAEKQEIEISRKQIENGETESWDSVYKRLV